MLYVVNPQNHYFVVDDESFKDELIAKGCTLLPTLDAMYQHVATVCGLEIEEVGCSEYHVINKVLFDDRGCTAGPHEELGIVDEVVQFVL